MSLIDKAKPKQSLMEINDMTDKQNNEQLITEEMLDWKFADIRYSEKRSTKANDASMVPHPKDSDKMVKESVENTVEMFFEGVTLRQSLPWSFSNRWIAEQPTLRLLGVEYLKSNNVLEFKLINNGKRSVFVNTSPEAVAKALIDKDMDVNEYAAMLIKEAKRIAKQREDEEAELMDGVEVPNEQ